MNVGRMGVGKERYMGYHQDCWFFAKFVFLPCLWTETERGFEGGRYLFMEYRDFMISMISPYVLFTIIVC